MRGNEPDTPGSTPRKHAPREQDHSDGDELNGEHSETEGSGVGFSRPDQVFDLGMDYDDEDVLLDWEQYAGMRRVRCCGWDVTWITKLLPCISFVPPEWWYSYSRTQRKILVAGVTAAAFAIAIVVGIAVLITHSQDLHIGKGEPAFEGGLEDAGAYPTCAWANWRLPDTVVPTMYHLQIQTDLEMVEGIVRIELEVKEASPCLVMHGVGMDITHATLLGPHTYGKWHMDKKLEQLTFHFERVMKEGNATVEIHFEYELRKGLTGFYMSTFTTDDKVIEKMGATQFEANGARRAFPCFDEPAFKATFNFTFITPPGMVALFNMPEVADLGLPAADGQVLHGYQVTPPMSTYLVAFIVGRLSCVSLITEGQPRNISVWGTPDRVQALQPALQMAAVILPEYERIFRVAYALPKLDLVAIPDFAAGAMENWGLIMYREVDLLVDPQDSGVVNLRNVALTVAHEMAHLWFGDLVTMEYWGDLWLNEGFATYFEHVGAMAARPEGGFFDAFFADVTSEALYADSLNKSTQPLAMKDVSHVHSSAQVEAFFDRIRYEKGGSLLRMLRAYLNRNAHPKPLLRRSLLEANLGDNNDVFLRGLSAYLQAHKFRNVKSADLWAALERETELDIPLFMNTWSYQPGYPLVSVRIEGNAVFVSQAPFTIGGVLACEEAAPQLGSTTRPWWVPVAYTSAAGTHVWTTFSDCAHQKPVYTLEDDRDWIKLNAGQYGLYRVSYPPVMWERLAAAATQLDANIDEAPLLATDDYAGLLDDTFALAQAGLTPISNFLNMTRALSQRPVPEYAPWAIVRPHFTWLLRLFRQDATHPACGELWAAYVRNLTTSFWAITGDPSNFRLDSPAEDMVTEPAQQRLLRAALLELGGQFDDLTVITFAQTLFQSRIAVSVSADIRGPVYNVVVRSGDATFYDAMKAIYLQATTAEEKARSLKALSFSKDPHLIQQTLDFSVGPDVRAQDTASVITSVAARGGASLTAAWAFVRERYGDIHEKLGGDTEADRFMGQLLERFGTYLATPDSLDEVRTVFREHEETLQEKRHMEAALEGINASLHWLEQHAGPACAWLEREEAR